MVWVDSMISFLDCSNNFLNGSVFVELFVFFNLVVVRFFGNNFIGVLLENVLFKIWELDFYSNNFVGIILKSIVILLVLEKLELFFN